MSFSEHLYIPARCAMKSIHSDGGVLTTSAGLFLSAFSSAPLHTFARPSPLGRQGQVEVDCAFRAVTLRFLTLAVVEECLAPGAVEVSVKANENHPCGHDDRRHDDQDLGLLHLVRQDGKRHRHYRQHDSRKRSKRRISRRCISMKSAIRMPRNCIPTSYSIRRYLSVRASVQKVTHRPAGQHEDSCRRGQRPRPGKRRLVLATQVGKRHDNRRCQGVPSTAQPSSTDSGTSPTVTWSKLQNGFTGAATVGPFRRHG